jgi:hypothetical protein
MPQTVSRFPQFPDPRSPTFGSWGSSPGSCSPWKWYLHSVDATGDYEPFVDGVILEPSYIADDQLAWASLDFPQNGWATVLTVLLQQEPLAFPSDWTHFYYLQVVNGSGTDWYSEQLFTYADPILELSFFQGYAGYPGLAYMDQYLQVQPRAYQLGIP